MTPAGGVPCWRAAIIFGEPSYMFRTLMRSIDRSVEFALFVIFLIFTLVGGLQIFNRFVKPGGVRARAI